MGKADIVTKHYMEDNTVFADAFNYFLYDGKQVIKPDNLHTLDATEVEVPYGADGAVIPVQRTRDEMKYLTAMTDERSAYVILGIEHQTNVHYAMPVKNMVYDALQYAGQVRKAADSHKRARDMAGHNPDEYLSGFYRDDKLIPVVTLVIFFSADAWDGPLSLYDMLSPTDKEIMSMIDNYRIHLIAPESLSVSDLDKFRTNLREVLEFIKYSNDKKKLNSVVSSNERYKRMDRKAAMVIETCTGTDLKIDEEEEAIDVCQAILDMRMEERTEGKIESRLEDIINLMDSLKCSVDKAMDILKLPENERKTYKDRI